MRQLLTAVGLGCYAATALAELPTPESAATVMGSSTSTALDIAPPVIAIGRDKGQIIITFTGTLQSAIGVNGPWSALPNATSPFEQNPSEAQVFYRAQSPENESIFSSRSIVEWIVTGPLQTHFDLAFAGLPDGIVPPRREKPPFEATLAMEGIQLPVDLRVRGNSSLQECPFPKLKLKVSKEHRKGTPFFDARELKIGTHCAEGGRGTIGRLRDERATFREVLAYEIMQVLEFTGPRVRRARIDFRDTSATNSAAPRGWLVTRNAMILEDPEVLGERLGGRALNDSELAELKNANFSEQLITELRFLHTLLGNWDYKLSTDGVGLWNTDVIELPDGKLVPVASDFDLSSWVTEQVLSRAPGEYHPELPELDRQALYDLGLIRQGLKREIFVAAQTRFESKREAIEAFVNIAEIDDAGRTNALNHITAFFGALTAGGE